MPMKPGHTEYLGDGVYAEFDGYSVSLDLRGEGRPEKIVLEPETYAGLMMFAEAAFGLKPEPKKSADDPVKRELLEVLMRCADFMGSVAHGGRGPSRVSDTFIQAYKDARAAIAKATAE